ncbi:MAG: hypothetical protein HZA54_20015 [Planctomycetes bacterium]|nr:hypothetical protein [Planctomycetota bacterium]
MNSASAPPAPPPAADAAQLLAWALTGLGRITTVARLPPCLLGAAVETGAVSASEGLRAAALFPDSQAIPALAPHLPPAAFPEALALARRDPRAAPRARSLLSLLPHAPEDVQRCILADLAPFARNPPPEWDDCREVVQALPTLPPALRDRLVADALAAIPGMGSDSDHGALLEGLAPALSGEPLRLALGLAHSLPSPQRRLRTLVALAEAASGPERIEATGTACAIVCALHSRAPYDLLRRLARRWSNDQAAAVLHWVLSQEAPADRAVALAEIGPHLPTALAVTALSAARALPDESERASSLVALLPSLPEEARAGAAAEVLDAAEELFADSLGTFLLGRAAPALPEGLIGRAWRIACSLPRPLDRGFPCAALIPRLPADLLEEAYRLPGGLPQASPPKVEVLLRLVDRAPPDRRADRVRAAWAEVSQDRLGLRCTPHVAETLRRLWDLPSETERQEAVRVALALGLSTPVDASFRLLLDCAPPAGRRAVVDEGLLCCEQEARRNLSLPLWSAVLDRLPEAARTACAARLFTAAVATLDSTPRWTGLIAALRHLETAEVPRALSRLRAVHPPGPSRRDAYEFVWRLSGSDRADVLLGEWPGDFLIELEPREILRLVEEWPRERLPEVLPAAARLRGRVGLRTAWRAIAARLSAPERSRALEAVARIPQEQLRASALAGMVSAFAAEGLTEGLEAAASLHPPALRARVLLALPVSAGLDPQEVARAAIQALRSIRRETTRLRFLRRLAPMLGRGAAVAWEDTGRYRDLRLRFRARCALLSRLEPPRRTDSALAALADLEAAGPERAVAHTLVAMLPLLPPSVTRDVARFARGRRDPFARAVALCAVSPALPETERRPALEQALTATGEIRDGRDRADARRRILHVVAPADRERVLDKELEAAGAIEDEEARARSLAALADAVGPELREDLLREALTAARLAVLRRCAHDRARIRTLATGLRPTPREDSSVWRGMYALSRMGCAPAPTFMLARLLRRLPPGLLDEAAKAIGEIPDPFYRHPALRALAAALTPDHAARTLDAYRSAANPQLAAEAWAVLLPRLPAARMPEAVGHLLGLPADARRSLLDKCLHRLVRWARTDAPGARAALLRWADSWRSADARTVLAEFERLLPLALALEPDAPTAAFRIEQVLAEWLKAVPASVVR